MFFALISHRLWLSAKWGLLHGFKQFSSACNILLPFNDQNIEAKCFFKTAFHPGYAGLTKLNLDATLFLHS